VGWPIHHLEPAVVTPNGSIYAPVVRGRRGHTPKWVDGSSRCAFCGKRTDEVDKLIAGPGVCICNECVALCVDIIENERARSR
jgi:hypothetical protein